MTPPAPVSPDEVLERGPMAPYVAGGQVPADVSRETAVDAPADVPADSPPLRREQIIKLEALTALWAREVRVAGSPDDTLLYAASAKPPPPPARRPLEVVRDQHDPPQVPAPEVVLERSRQLLEEEAAEASTPTAPAPVPARVSDWTSRHDPRSLEYPVRQRLARAVPLADVSLDAGPVLDQGTTPPLTVRDASACVGMGLTTAANVLRLRAGVAQVLAHQSASVELLDEVFARKLYDLAQDLDHVHGKDYAGTSVLGGLKAGQELGLWDGYLWALGGTKDVAQVLLQLRVAVVVGVPWSSQLEEPDRWGVIRPGGTDAGGHALAVVGLKLGMLGGSPGPWFELQQSRGPAEGNQGRVYLHHTALARLLAGVGEAGVPLPAE